MLTKLWRQTKDTLSTLSRDKTLSLSKRPKQQKSRALTESEVIMAKSVFGDQLDIRDVRLKTAWWVLKNYAVSPNGNIYFNPQDWVEDFTKASLSKQSWLIHELTHVWQLQQGLKVVRGALVNRRYRYVLKEGKSFFKYGIEQQARMVQDYYIRRTLGQDCRQWEACIPFLANDKINRHKNHQDKK